jgi:YgiT-type zinc finger domain-containing protein
MKKNSSPQAVCDICGKSGVRIRHVSETHGKGKNLLVIENVPMVSCPNCGESYFTAETLHEIERLKRQRRALAVERPVEVLSYAE